MKLGILTFHRTINEGSLLQAYCLQRLIQSHFPDSQVEIIDYQRLNTMFRDLKKLFLKKPPFIHLSQLGKYVALNLFRIRQLRSSKKKCLTNKSTKAKEFISAQKYDAIFVGSDTVWRIQNRNFDLPEENVYYLKGLNACPKISFAASMDKSRHELLEKPNINKSVYKSLSEFERISIRDIYSRQCLIGAGFPERKIAELPDPTLLWDFSPMIKDVPKLRYSSRLIGISLSSIRVKKMLSEYFINQGFKVLNMLGHSIFGQKKIPCRLTYQQRLGIYQKIEFLITDRFHGSILAFRIGKTPVVFLENSQDYPDQVHSKGYDLFHRLKIPWAVYRFDDDTFSSDDIDRIDSILIQWSQLNPDVSNDIDRLKADAQPKIDEIFDVLK
jgi:hypothetical protein